jgi:hypothetical protein
MKSKELAALIGLKLANGSNVHIFEQRSGGFKITKNGGRPMSESRDDVLFAGNYVECVRYLNGQR